MAHAAARRPEWPRWKLPDISEQKVLKLGILRLRRCLGAGEAPAAAGMAPPVELPRRKDGSALLMQESFLRRLLSEELELKGACQSDVSAAQSDLRYLNCEQLLAIRAQTLDFVTISESHSAHNNFLASVDGQLLEKLALRCLAQDGGSCGGGRRPPPTPQQQRPEVLRCLGLRMMLCLGAAEVLEAEEGAAASAGPVPTRWAIRLDEATWGGHGAAAFDLERLRVDFLEPGVGAGAGAAIAVVSDRASGEGRDRRLHWEVAALDPQQDDVLAEMARKSEDEQAKRCLSKELASAIRSRLSPRAQALGLVDMDRGDSGVFEGGGEPPTSDAAAAAEEEDPWTPERGLVARAVSRIEEMTPPAPAAWQEALAARREQQRKRKEAQQLQQLKERVGLQSGAAVEEELGFEVEGASDSAASASTVEPEDLVSLHTPTKSKDYSEDGEGLPPPLSPEEEDASAGGVQAAWPCCGGRNAAPEPSCFSGLLAASCGAQGRRRG